MTECEQPHRATTKMQTRFILSGLIVHKQLISSSVSLLTRRNMSSRVAVCQMLATSDVEENFKKVESLVLDAKKREAKVSVEFDCGLISGFIENLKMQFDVQLK